MKLRWLILCAAFLLVAAPPTRAQNERTLAGEWIMVSSPINGENFSRLGNSLGFPDRDMVFSQEGELRNGVVLREDVGASVRPLGSWRGDGKTVTAPLLLWGPENQGTCRLGHLVGQGFFQEYRQRSKSGLVVPAA